MPVIRPLDSEVFVVLVERDGELVQEAIGPEHALEGHLQGGISNEGYSRGPLVVSVSRETEVDHLELGAPMTTKDADHARVSACVAESDTDRLTGTPIEERDRRTRVD
jgi:hypothetical protein